MNSALPLLSLLPNGNYGNSPSFGESSLSRGYGDYVGGGSDSESGAGQGLDFSYPYPDDLGFVASHGHYSRPSSAQESSQSTSSYPHLVQPDFASHAHNGYREHNGTAHSDRFLDLDLGQPGPSTYRHGSGLYSGSEASHEDPSSGFVESRDDDVKVEHSDPAPADDGEADNEEPLYVNAKQYHRILKRRLARARLEELNRLVRSRKPYLHESRHRHACSRPRGKGGRFLTADEIEALKREEAAKENGSGSASIEGDGSGSASAEASAEGSPNGAA